MINIAFKQRPICKASGCIKIAADKGAYCSEHSKASAGYLEQRDGYRQHYQTNDWHKKSKRIRDNQMHCQHCYDNGRLVKANLVHHIVSIRDGGTDDESNLIPLCRSCHDLVHKQT